MCRMDVCRVNPTERSMAYKLRPLVGMLAGAALLAAVLRA